MKIVIDTSAIIAVITNEVIKERIIKATLNSELIAPTSVHWEIANAFSAMFKQNRISLENSKKCLNEYKNIPIQFLEVDLSVSVDLSFSLGIYAYDTFLIACSLINNAPLFEKMGQANYALEFSKGHQRKAIVYEFTPLDLKNTCIKIGMTQNEFVSAFGISVSTLRHWVRGDRKPHGPALVLLNVAAKESQTVLKLLAIK